MAISNTDRGARPGICTSTTRPSNPYEGFIIYETDTDMLTIWNGSAWRYIAATTPTNGTVLQVVSTTKTDTFTTTSTSMTDITGLNASITPKSSSSKILVEVKVSAFMPATERGGFRIVRDSTAIGIADSAGSRTRSGFAIGGPSYTNSVYDIYSTGQTFLDSPATTSSTTYKVQMYVSNGTACINRSGTDTDAFWQPRSTSSITLMEIAG